MADRYASPKREKNKMINKFGLIATIVNRLYLFRDKYIIKYGKITIQVNQQQLNYKVME